MTQIHVIGRFTKYCIFLDQIFLMMLIMSIININNIGIEKKAEKILCLIHNVAL